MQLTALMALSTGQHIEDSHNSSVTTQRTDNVSPAVTLAQYLGKDFIHNIKYQNMKAIKHITDSVVQFITEDIPTYNKTFSK